MCRPKYVYVSSTSARHQSSLSQKLSRACMILTSDPNVLRPPCSYGIGLLAVSCSADSCLGGEFLHMCWCCALSMFQKSLYNTLTMSFTCLLVSGGHLFLFESAVSCVFIQLSRGFRFSRFGFQLRCSVFPFILQFGNPVFGLTLVMNVGRVSPCYDGSHYI